MLKVATYAQIKEYILEKFNLKVSTLYIAQIKKKCGIALRENYNKSNIKKHVGHQFIIYEEDGKYEISFEKESGGVSLGDVCYPITKELMEKAFKSDRDAYEVKIYAETGSWPTNNQDETDREFIREYPELVLKNPERCKKQFSKEEYEHLVKIAKEEQEKEENK